MLDWVPSAPYTAEQLLEVPLSMVDAILHLTKNRFGTVRVR